MSIHKNESLVTVCTPVTAKQTTRAVDTSKLLTLHPQCSWKPTVLQADICSLGAALVAVRVKAGWAADSLFVQQAEAAATQAFLQEERTKTNTQ